MYVRPSREIKKLSSYLRLPSTAAYGLVNSNSKCQYQCDGLLISLGLVQSRNFLRLLYKMQEGHMVLLVSKFVDKVKVTGI